MRHFVFTLFLLASISIKSQDLSVLYKKVNPAVVVILTEEKALKQVGAYSKMVNSEGLGSGFLISENQILTAAHVVDVAERVLVKFTDGKTIKATVTSSFKDPDIALITLAFPKKNTKPVTLGDSDLTKVGERIFVVGAPFGLAHSLSSGYISGRMKNDGALNPFTNSEYLQTDAAINTGNSGGPMFNLKGEVIGIVSHIKSITGGFQGIGFAASSNIAKELLLDRNIPWSGAEVLPLSESASKVLNVPQKNGLLVQRVVSSSPYGKLGLRGGNVKATIDKNDILLGGDIILAINGIRFEMTDETLKKIGDYAASVKPEDPIVLEVLREGKIISLRN
ncbi:S1C family serine protease [Cellulophaga baltica]|uniref:S1C family serine protease n=1 Tax=Cellulophaga baltica TaxID=76594 RepID=UPI0024947884|nr:trypsin-like peptidase domain-containing protein [Cellulophaga baltica]